jgi:hypothetical protein
MRNFSVVSCSCNQGLGYIYCTSALNGGCKWTEMLRNFNKFNVFFAFVFLLVFLYNASLFCIRADSVITNLLVEFST